MEKEVTIQEENTVMFLDGVGNAFYEYAETVCNECDKLLKNREDNVEQKTYHDAYTLLGVVEQINFFMLATSSSLPLKKEARKTAGDNIIRYRALHSKLAELLSKIGYITDID